MVDSQDQKVTKSFPTILQNEGNLKLRPQYSLNQLLTIVQKLSHLLNNEMMEVSQHSVIPRKAPASDRKSMTSSQHNVVSYSNRHERIPRKASTGKNKNKFGKNDYLSM